MIEALGWFFFAGTLGAVSGYAAGRLSRIDLNQDAFSPYNDEPDDKLAELAPDRTENDKTVAKVRKRVTKATAIKPQDKPKRVRKTKTAK